MIKRILGWTGALALAALAGCSGGSGTSGPTVTGGVVKGPVLGSQVCAYAVKGGAKGAQLPLGLAIGATGSISGNCYLTGADGSYAFTVPDGTSGDVLIEATGGQFCTNETPIVAGACPGGGTVVNLGPSVMSSLVAVPVSGVATVYVTPLTTAAVGRTSASMSVTAFNTQFNSLAGTIIGAGTTVTPATPPTAGNQPYLTAAASYLQSGGTLGGVITGLANGTTTFAGGAGSGSGTTSTATINPGVTGVYNLRFYVGGGDGCGSVCPYSDGQDVPVTVGSDGSLSIPGKTLTQPYYRNYGSGPHLPEIIWLDAAAGVEYALTNNESGSFSEINVGDASTPQALGTPRFLGQLRKPEPSSSGTLAALQGTYAFGQQYAGTDVAWTSITIGSDGAISFEGTGPAIPSANIATVTSYVSCCNKLDIVSNANIDGNAGVTVEDKVSLYLNADGTLKDVEYYISNVRYGVSVGTPYALPSAQDNGAAIPTGNTVRGTVGSTDVALAINFFTGNTTGGFSLTAQELSGDTLVKQWVINVTNAAGVALNTNYSCVHGSRSKRIDLKLSGDRNTYEGGNCNVYITRLESTGSTITAVEGRFTAELFSYRRDDAVRVVDGSFKYVAP
jgi:hypothetical protein